MPDQVPALKVSVYICEGESHRGIPLSAAILNFLFYRGIADAVAIRASAGFGAEQKLRSSSSVELSDRLPVVVQFLDAKDKVDALMGKLREMAGQSTIEIQETAMLARTSLSKPEKHTTAHLSGDVSVMDIYIGESDRWNGIPLHQALVDAFRSNDVSGVTVARGTLGYGTKKEIHKERAFRLSSDLPIVVSVIERQEKIQELTPLLDQMLGDGLVVIHDATVVAYAHRPAG